MALSRSNRTDWLWLAAALSLGLLVAWFDLHTDDDGIIAGLLLIFGAVLGMGRPAGAWRWALALGACVPIGEFLSVALVSRPATMTQALSSLVALVFAFIGVYVGVWLRRASS